MTHWIVVRRCKDGTSVRVGVAADGEVAYIHRHGDELRLADRESADAFRRVVRRAGQPVYANMTDEYDLVEIGRA